MTIIALNLQNFKCCCPAYSGSHTHTNEGAHTHHLVTFSLSNGRITLFNALKVGDIVYMLPVNKGKKYFILDRRG